MRPAHRTVARLVAFGLGLLALAWAIDVYSTKVDDRVGVGEPPQDLGVFLRAAGAVLHGHSPYAFRADQTYAYPPALAFLVVLFFCFLAFFLIPALSVGHQLRRALKQASGAEKNTDLGTI